MRKRLTTEEFVERAKNVHRGKYDYSKVDYVDAKTKVCIICPEHGEFWQTPDSHLRGKGCKKCAHDMLGYNKRLNTNQFIIRSKEVHGDKYDYTKIDYIHAKVKVCIICPEHGEFWQTPFSHIGGCGCPRCKSEKLATERRKGKTTFIKTARQIHGYKYDYSKVEYVNANTKVCIVCPEHGEFWQTPSNHINEEGCPKCAGNIPYNTKSFIEKAKQIYGDKYDFSKVEYKDIRTKVCVTCLSHGDFEITPDNLLHGHGCNKCKESKLEKNVRDILEENKIEYVYQKKFDWLGKKSLDFFLPKYSIAIECQGLQHYKPVDFAGKGKEWAEKEFEKTLERDKIKLEEVKNHSIKMIYVNEENKNNFLKDIL